MYFEARQNEVRPLRGRFSFRRLAEEIKQLSPGEAITAKGWLFVNDQPTDNHGRLLEVAILTQEGEEFYQWESLTADWVQLWELENWLESWIEKPNRAFRRPVAFNQDHAPAWFLCGCCGTSFQSTMKDQRRHDQDAGFGICPDCEAWVTGKNRTP